VALRALMRPLSLQPRSCRPSLCWCLAWRSDHSPRRAPAGVLRYQDTSTGHMVAQHKTKLGPCSVMRQNPHNAVLCLGHARGSMTMWTPNITTPVVKMLCHRGPITALAVDAGGHHMVTAGADQQVKVGGNLCARGLRQVRPVPNRYPFCSGCVVIHLQELQRHAFAAGDV
jgi:hypothetical protein